VSMRVVIAGGPRVGKTARALELAAELNATVRHTDTLIGAHARGEDAAEVARWMGDRGPWVIEGVTAARGLRTWLARNPTGRPCDEVVVLRQPLVQLTPKQAAMAKGCETVWREIAPQLAARGVTVVTRG
jgi:broad-specificity NMP kinase